MQGNKDQMSFKCRKKTYPIEIGDLIIDDNLCMRLIPKDKHSCPFISMDYRLPHISRRKWNRLLKECNFEITQKLYSTVYYIFKGVK